MSIPRRARIFGQPTKLQRDALIGGQIRKFLDSSKTSKQIKKQYI